MTCLPGWSKGMAATAATAYCPTSRSAPTAGCVLRLRGGGVGGKLRACSGGGDGRRSHSDR